MQVDESVAPVTEEALPLGQVMHSQLMKQPVVPAARLQSPYSPALHGDAHVALAAESPSISPKRVKSAAEKDPEEI